MDLLQHNKKDFELAGCARRLLRQRFLLREKNSQWFQLTCTYRNELTQIFAPFFQNLIVDENLGVAFLQETDPEIEEKLSYQFTRSRKLSALSSILLFQLRHERLQFYLNPEENTRPQVKLSDLREFLQEFDQNEVDARFERNFQKAVKELIELQVLLPNEGDQRFEISCVCDLLLPLDTLSSYKNQLNQFFKAAQS